MVAALGMGVSLKTEKLRRHTSGLGFRPSVRRAEDVRGIIMDGQSSKFLRGLAARLCYQVIEESPRMPFVLRF